MKNQENTVETDLLKQSLENPGQINKSSLPTSGPQFGLKHNPKKEKWVKKYGSSVILPIIALLILAGGIYLYANQKGNTTDSLLEGNTANIQGNLTGGEQDQIVTQEQTIADDKEVIPEAIKQDGNIIEKAIRGDGVTNLSRRALKDYLKDNPKELTNEHKIYIEDYLKDNIGSRPLEVGEEISFSEDLIKQAIDASLELTPEQLKNLEKYSALVAW